MTARIRRRIRVCGRVQGVWFRGATRDEALRRGVAGWIRNRPDGSVEALLEGLADAVDAVIAFCRRGPPSARVERVEIEDEAAGALEGFEIRR